MAFFGDPTIFGVLLTGTKIALLAAVLAPMLRYAALERFGQDDGAMKTLRFCALLMAAVVTIGIALVSFGINIRMLLPNTISPIFSFFVSGLIVVLAVVWFLALRITRLRERSASVTIFEFTTHPMPAQASRTAVAATAGRANGRLRNSALPCSKPVAKICCKTS
ncbi:MAG: hypothetical protein V2I43_06610 [Parvularcula sp.]|jgi:hypothetical protein|nr:hypothetical protein [Parvularcula sp.]